MRTLRSDDFAAYQEVRARNAEWLTKWEPSRLPGAPDPVADLRAFSARCAARDRDRQTGVGYGFGMFVDGTFIGEVNLNSIQRGPFQNAYVGYWVDEKCAGKSYTPEAVAVLLRYAFEQLDLHRVQISIIPRNAPSHRVVAKLGIRKEGTAERYLEINGAWEDHVRYAITSEEWAVRRDEFAAAWF